MSDENKFWLLIDLKLLVYSNCNFIIKCNLFSVVFFTNESFANLWLPHCFINVVSSYDAFEVYIDGSED